jgi:biotin operon repressor
MDDTKELNMEIEEYKQLKTADIAKHLNIAESTVRKYAQVLEKQGYQFRKDPTLGRIYTSIDEVAVNELIKLRKDAKMGLDMAAEIVATHRINGNKNVAPTHPVQPSEKNDFSMKNMKSILHDMQYIKENQVSKDQVNYVVETVGKVLDINKDLQQENVILKGKLDTMLETQQKMYELMDKAEKEKKDGIWKRIFG